MRKWKILFFVLVVLIPGCGLGNWDINKKIAESKGPGISARGNLTQALWKADGSVFVWVWSEKEPGTLELRKAPTSFASGFASDFDLIRLGPQKKLSTDVSTDIKGNAGASGSQWPWGWTIQEILMLVAGIIIIPLVAGIILFIIPGTKSIGIKILSVYGKIFGLIINLFKKKEKEDVKDTGTN